ncbi:MAG TPA: glycosyltransferase family 39 protein [Candidatus Paceibacterota bacterium]
MTKSSKIILAIAIFAFLVRIVGIDYGLPLMLIHDEPPAVFGALKMIELKTLLPVLHESEFKSVLYYPPYLSYVYVPFFSLAVGFKYLTVSHDMSLLKNLLIADPSIFFLIARLISALLGALTVYLVYLIGRRLFESEKVGILSALFLAFSYVHNMYSHWGRHWIAVTFIFTLVIYFLTKREWSDKTRYLLAVLALGLGVGINFQIAVGVLILPLWFIFIDRKSIKEAIRMPWVWAALALFVSLGAIAYLVYPSGFVVASTDVVNGTKNLAGFLLGYVFHLSNLLSNDPMILIFLLVGGVLAFKNRQSFAKVALSFILLYIGIFYILLFQVDRYIIMLYPIFALLAGYGLSQIKSKILIISVFVFSGIMVLRYDQLLLKGDTRTQALEWISKYVSPRTRVVTMVDKLRVPSIPEAISEQERIDPGSLRSADRAERENLNKENYYALNLYTVRNDEFNLNVPKYLSDNKFQYLVIDKNFAASKNLSSLTSLGGLASKFDGYDEESGDVANWFGGGLYARETIPWFHSGLLRLWQIPNPGPTLEIRRIY